MNATLDNRNVHAHCPDCNALCTFLYKEGASEYGCIIVNTAPPPNDKTIYRLMKCGGCGRGGIAVLYKDTQNREHLHDFYPLSVARATLPHDVPEGISTEFQEAELCASVGAYRAASALLRSVLDKTLKHNGYKTGNKNLRAMIDEAADDSVITDSRRKRAHEDIRVLGNDILHDEWREISEQDYSAAHRYAQRILEDFYDDRGTVEETLKEKGRIKENEISQPESDETGGE